MPIPVLARQLSGGYKLEQQPRQGLPAWPWHCQTSTPSFDMV